MADSSERDRLAQIAEAYATNPAAVSRTEQELNDFIAEQAAQHVRGPEVLVLGAATGCWARPLLARLDSFDCVDAVEALVTSLVEAHDGRIRGHVAMFEELTPDKRYDSVVMGHVLEHVEDPVAVLTRAREWLRAAGRAVITVPNARSLHRQIGVELGVLADAHDFSAADRALGHRRVYDSDSLRADLKAAGYACSLMTGLALKPLSNTQMDDWDPDLRRAYFNLGEHYPDNGCALLAVAAPATPA